MTAPVRWLDEASDASDLERELLRSGQAPVLSESDKQQLWDAIAAKAAPPIDGSGGGGSAGPALAAGSGAGLVKGASLLSSIAWFFVAGVLAGGLTIGALVSLKGVPRTQPGALLAPGLSAASVAVSASVPDPPPSALLPEEPRQTPRSAPKQIIAEPTAAQSASASPGPEPAVSAAGSRSAAPAEPAPAETTVPLPSQERITRLREESAMVRHIREVLRAGKASQALQLLAEAGAKFPDGVLGQEREALTIEALARSGARAAAGQRAAQFLRSYPNSPHARDVQPFLQNP